MAVFTPLTLNDAQHVLRAYGLSEAREVIGIAEGSVNSNFFVRTDEQTYFVRLYEEQSTQGVTYEWALMDHLGRRGLAVPRRIVGTSADMHHRVLQVAGKPVGVFECAEGESVCQSMVTEQRAAEVGRFLGAAHMAGLEFAASPQTGRFTPVHMHRRIESIREQMSSRTRDEVLAQDVRTLEQALVAVQDAMDDDRLPRGVIHADLFRDNVRWQGDSISAVIDWESSSQGPLAYDLMVTLLAWCYGDDFEWGCAQAMAQAYHQKRALTPHEQRCLRSVASYAAIRFGITRITDFHLRQSVGERTHKSYKRFMSRLAALQAMSDAQFAQRLGFL
jgi:homoserine kinase type II